MRRSQPSSRDRVAGAAPADASDLASLTSGSNSRQRPPSRGEKERRERVERARSAAALNRVQEVEAQNAQLRRFKDAAREQAAELQRCVEQLGEKDLQVRDLKYEVAKLRRERAAQEEERKEADARNRANILALRTGLENLERSVKEKHAYLTQETGQMLDMVEALLRHTMNGFHAGPTKTASELLQTLQSRLTTVHETLKIDQWATSGSSSSTGSRDQQERQISARPTSSSGQRAAKSGAEMPQPPRLSQKSASSASIKGRTAASSSNGLALRGAAATTASRRPGEVGRSVSVEAGIAAHHQQQPAAKTAQTATLKADPAMAKLINQYRSVIVKEREQSTLLKNQLAQEKLTNEQLRQELEQLRADLQDVFHDRKIDHGKLIAAEADKARLMMMFEGLVGAEELESRKLALRQRHKKSHRRRSRGPPAPSHDDESSYGPGVTSEEAAEQDLRLLDDQIGRLKMQLERAALDHTNEIMSKVVQCAGSSQQHIATSP